MAKKIFWALSNRERIAFILALVVAISSGTTLAAVFIEKNTLVVPAYGGEYIEGIVGQPAFINPVLAKNESDKSLIRLIFSNITDVAENILSSEDRRTWKVRLKENTLWHDGEKLTSDDIIFTVQRIQDPESQSPASAIWQGIVAQRISEREVQFSLGIPYPLFERTHLKTLYILPKHLFADIPTANWRLSDFNLKPVGSGPYRFESFERGEGGFISFMKLRAVRGEETKQGPYIKRFDIRFFTNRKDAIESYNAGHIDGISGVEPSELGLIRRPYNLIRFKFPSYYAVFLNQTQHLALKDKAVREALSRVIDRAQIGESIFHNLGAEAYGPIPEFALNEDDNAPKRISIQEANALLENAGWLIEASNIRAKKIKEGSLTLEFQLTVPDVSFLKDTAEQLKMTWEKIGAKITLKILPPEEVLEKIIKNREYQMLLFGNVLNSTLDPFSFWHSSERFYPGLNLSLYNSKEADKAIEAFRQSANDNERKEKLLEFQQIIAEDIPAIFLYTPDYLYVTTNDLKGVPLEIIGEGAERLNNVEKWYLKTARILKNKTDKEIK